MEFNLNLIPIVAFIFLLIILASEKINRSIITSLFAVFFVVFGLTSFEEALKSIDFNTIGLLVGMMIIVSVLAKTGLFQFLAIKMVKIARGRPIRLMLFLSFLTAFLSAFLDNVTTILLITPVTLYITRIINLTAYPLVLSLIFFSNIGGTATLIGDPPNIIIGSEAKLSFNEFLLYNGPIVLINLILTSVLIFFFFRKRLREKKIPESLVRKIKEENLIKDKKFLVNSLIVLFLVIIGFLTHNITKIENSIIALAGAFLILLITKKEPDEFYKEIEWTSIFFFIGLFVLVGAIEATGVLEAVSKALIDLTKGNVEMTAYSILSFVGIVSGFVDNIPITVVFARIIREMASFGIDVSSLWWALSLGACFGGNLTVIGASANVVGVDIFNKNNETKEKIDFFSFLKYGLLVTLVNLISSLIYLKLVFF